MEESKNICANSTSMFVNVDEDEINLPVSDVYYSDSSSHTSVRSISEGSANSSQSSVGSGNSSQSSVDSANSSQSSVGSVVDNYELQVDTVRRLERAIKSVYEKLTNLDAAIKTILQKFDKTMEKITVIKKEMQLLTLLANVQMPPHLRRKTPQRNSSSSSSTTAETQSKLEQLLRDKNFP